VTLHLTQFEGGNALSSFRAQQLLTDLVAIHPKITGVSARFVHLVATEGAVAPALQERLSALLTYGDPYKGSVEGLAFIVTPAWAPSRPGPPRPPTSPATAA
jgi:phosphoribosylformylglycinamidine synthase